MLTDRVRARGHWKARICNPVKDAAGEIVGYEEFERRIEWENLVVNQGLDDLLDVTLAGGTQDTTWFVGLTGTEPTPAAGDTLASHAGWTEQTGYDEADRQAWTPGAVAGQAVSNAGDPAVFTVSADATTVGGAFLAGVASGTSGRLYAVGAFSGGDVVLNEGATIEIVAEFTTAAAA